METCHLRGRQFLIGFFVKTLSFKVMNSRRNNVHRLQHSSALIFCATLLPVYVLDTLCTFRIVQKVQVISEVKKINICELTTN